MSEKLDEGRIARAGLLRLAEPPAAAVAAFVAELGAPGAFESVITRDAPPAVLAATEARTAERTAAQLRGLAERDLEVAAKAGAVLLCPEDPGWPAAAFAGFTAAGLRGVSGAAAPLALYVKGALPANAPDRAVTVVGSRACTGYGERTTAEMSVGLAEAGLAVVSGGAFGIDTAAHRATISCGGVSIAVLACGVDRSYPVANAALLARVAAEGAVVSEYPPGTTPARHRFLVRNRLLAALGAVTVVVEAGRRSGALSTAAAAGHLGRTVMAVPGPVTSGLSVGCHLLLRERFALLATDADDVLEVLGPLQPTLFDAAAATAGEVSRPTDGLDPVALRVYDALPARAASTIAELSVSSGIPGAQVLAALPILELSGLAHRDGPTWRRR